MSNDGVNGYVPQRVRGPLITGRLITGRVITADVSSLAHRMID